MIFKAAGGNIVEMPIAGPLADAITEHKHLKGLVNEYETKLLQLEPKGWSHGISNAIFLALASVVLGLCALFCIGLGLGGSNSGGVEDVIGLFVVVVWLALPIGIFIYAINNYKKKNDKIVQEREVLQQKKNNVEEKIVQLESRIMELIRSKMGG